MAAVISLYLLFFLVALLVFYFIGAGVLWCFRYEVGGFYTSFFYRSLAGLVASVLLFSLFASSFKTIQWGIVIVGLFTWYEFRLSAKKEHRSFVRTVTAANKNWKSWIPLLLLAGIIFSWFAAFTFNWQGDFWYAMPHKDKVYYTNISSALVEFGYENRQGAYYPHNLEPITEPYHYFDLWLTAMLSFFTAKPTVLIVSLLSLPVCALIAAAGILSIFEMRGALKTWHYVLAVLLLFLRGLYLERKDPQIAWAENFTESVMEFKSEKLGVLYILILFSFRIFLAGNMLPAMASLLVLPVISIGNSAGVLSGLLLFTVVALVNKIVTVGSGLRFAFYCVLVAGFIYAFYHFTGGSTVYLDKGPLVFTDIETINFHSIKVAFVELFVRVINNPWRTILMHLPFLLIATVTIKTNKNYGRAFLLTGCIYFVSLAAYGVFYKLVDSPQFYTNNLPLLNVCLMIGAVLFFSSGYNMITRSLVMAGLSIILCVLVFSAVQTYRESRSFTELYSDKYLCAVDSIHRTLSEKKNVAILYDPSQKPDLYNSDMSGPNILHLPFFTKFRVPVDLNVFENREFSWGGEMGEIQKRFMRRAPFQKFVLRQAAEGSFRDLRSSQLDYIKYEHIQYLFMSGGAGPDHSIVALVRKRIVDERSGEQLLILNEVP